MLNPEENNQKIYNEQRVATQKDVDRKIKNASIQIGIILFGIGLLVGTSLSLKTAIYIFFVVIALFVFSLYFLKD